MERFEPIAITGIGCRFPGGAHGPGAFWQMLVNGGDAITEIPADRWNIEAYYDSSRGLPGRTDSKWGGFVAHLDHFDGEFFGISPREAASMDPQQRWLLETAWEAMEDAGYVVDPQMGASAGVFIGIATDDYTHLQINTESSSRIDVHTTTGSVRSIAANRLSFALNLRGPSFAVDTACSSSLVALHLACRSLRLEECPVALVGGVNALISAETFIGFSRMGMLSPSGRCHAFDARADGYVRGEGVGVVVLRPLKDARAAGDRIYAIIRGTAVNQDGRTSSLTVPGLESQKRLLREACQDAGIEPCDLDYVEAHGTGTPVGDPIEAEALGSVISTRRTKPACLLGSVKTNIGHLEAGSGIAGVIKAALALHHEILPPNLHFVEPNPTIDLARLHLRVPTAPEPLPSQETLVGVNSFGFGGTNAHAVLQGFRPPPPAPSPTQDSHLLCLSARNEAGLQALATQHAAFLNTTDAPLSDICSTLGSRRLHLPHRLAVACSTKENAQAALQAYLADEPFAGLSVGQAADAPKVAFVFTGQGPQWWGMGRQMLESHRGFHAKLAELDSLFRTWGEWSLLEELTRDEATTRMGEPAIAQPAIFAIQVALVEWWREHGVTADAAVGHSVGEAAAAFAAGALDLPSAARVIFERGRCMDRAPAKGAMLAVALSPEAIAPWLAGFESKACIGAINSPRSVTLSGQPAVLAKIAARLDQGKIWHTFLRVNYAFHSPQMDPVRRPLLAALSGIQSQPPKIPLASTVTGALFEQGDFCADYWWANVREPVRFSDGIRALAEVGCNRYLEIGPHPALSSYVSETLRLAGLPGKTASSLRREHPEHQTLLASLALLHTEGVTALWPQQSPPVDLPPRPWTHTRHWNETRVHSALRLLPPPHPLLRRQISAADPVWETILAKGIYSYFEDHKVGQRAVFPASAYVEMAFAIARTMHESGPLALEDVEFSRAMLLPSSDQQAHVHISLQSPTNSFRIHTLSENASQWTAHCSGTLHAAALAPAVSSPPADIYDRCTEILSQEAFYALMASYGFLYGPAFRGVTRVVRQEGEAIGEVEAPPGVTTDHYLLHPAVLDACLQVGAATLPHANHEAVYLPERVGHLKFYRQPEGRLLSHAVLRTSNASFLSLDYRIFDEQGLVAEVTGFRSAAVEQTDAQRGHTFHCLYALEWNELPAGSDCPSPPPLRIHGAAPPSFATQAQSHPAADQILFFADPSLGDNSDAATKLCADLLHLVHELERDRAAGGTVPKGLTVVTQAGTDAGGTLVCPAQAAVHAFARALMSECSHLGVRIVDLPADGSTDGLLEAFEGHAAGEVALRAGVRFTQRLVRAMPEALGPLASKTPFRLVKGARGSLDELSFVRTARTPPGPGEVEIEVNAVGLNFRDVMKALGIYPIESETDRLLGDECAGRVVRVGEGVSSLQIGDAVMALSQGAFSSFVTAAAHAVMPLPRGLDDEAAATIPVAFLTAHYALKHIGRLARGEHVLIHAAAGGVGLAAIQVARDAGAHIFATAGSQAKRDLVRSLGAHVMDSRSLAFAEEIRDLTKGRGVDVVLNSLAGEAMTKSLSVLAPYGRFLEIGKRDIYQNFPLGLRPFRRNLTFSAIDLGQVLRDQPSLVAAMLEELSEKFRQGIFTPLPRRVHPIRDVRSVFREMAQGSHSGKLVLTMEPTGVRVQAEPHDCLTLDPHATYLVTGGTRGFGLAIADWLVERGAKHLLLIGATEASASEAYKRFQERGSPCNVRCAAVDVADLPALEALLCRVRKGLPPLRGLVHAAARYDDCLVRDLTPERLAHVMAPKATGAWNLHNLTRQDPLDFFVLISSISSVLGNPGQSNYVAANGFLDGLAHHRRALGLPALVLNWGPISEVGFAARNEDVMAHLERHGLPAMPPGEALEIFDHVLRTEAIQTSAFHADWPRWATCAPRAAKSSRYATLISTPDTASGQDHGSRLAEIVRGATQHERLQILETVVQECAAKILGITAGQIDPAKPLNQAGLDSLMAIELANRLEECLEVPFPTEKLSGSPSIKSLSVLLAEAFPAMAERTDAPGVTPAA